MGIDYKAAIMVGLPQCKCEYDEDEYDDLVDFLEEHEMEICSPYYDGSDADHAIAGFIYKCSASYDAVSLKWDKEKIDKMKSDFKRITGQEAQVWLSPWGY